MNISIKQMKDKTVKAFIDDREVPIDEAFAALTTLGHYYPPPLIITMPDAGDLKTIHEAMTAFRNGAGFLTSGVEIKPLWPISRWATFDQWMEDYCQRSDLPLTDDAICHAMGVSDVERMREIWYAARERLGECTVEGETMLTANGDQIEFTYDVSTDSIWFNGHKVASWVVSGWELADGVDERLAHSFRCALGSFSRSPSGPVMAQRWFESYYELPHHHEGRMMRHER